MRRCFLQIEPFVGTWTHQHPVYGTPLGETLSPIVKEKNTTIKLAINTTNLFIQSPRSSVYDTERLSFHFDVLRCATMCYDVLLSA